MLLRGDYMVKTIGEGIKAARQAAGLTQKELAEKLGISASAVGQFEKSDNMRTETIEKIADVLGVSPYSIIFYDPEPFPIGSDDPEGTAEVERALFGKVTNRTALDISYNKLNNLGKEEAVKRVEELTYIEKYTKSDEDK